MGLELLLTPDILTLVVICFFLNANKGGGLRRIILKLATILLILKVIKLTKESLSMMKNWHILQ